MDITKIVSTTTNPISPEETYNEEDTVTIAQGRWHSVVEKTFPDGFKVLYLRTEHVMILDYDYSESVPPKLVLDELTAAQHADPGLRLHVWYTPRGLHVMVMDRIFNLSSNREADIRKVANLFPTRDALNWKACMSRRTWGARLTHKPDENMHCLKVATALFRYGPRLKRKPDESVPVAAYAFALGSETSACIEAKTVEDEYARLLEAYA